MADASAWACVICSILAMGFGFGFGIPTVIWGSKVSSLPQGVCLFSNPKTYYDPHYTGSGNWASISIYTNATLNGVSFPIVNTWPPCPTTLCIKKNSDVQAYESSVKGADQNCYIDVSLDDKGSPIIQPGVRYTAYTEFLGVIGGWFGIAAGIVGFIAFVCGLFLVCG